MKKSIAFILFASAVCSASAFAASRRTPVVEAVEKCSPAVVNISTERIIRQQYDDAFGFRDRMFDELFREYRNRFRPREYRSSSLGSGVIIDDTGIVVTNEHVISKASKITVTLPDKSQYEATLLSSDPDNDLAVLKIDADHPLPCVKMGISSDLMIGETVIAMGNPFGLANSVSVGVLSATDRTVSSEGRVVLENLVQLDAPINPGNSGGPLVNINGELIGINTAIVAEAQGIGFALPVDRVKTVLASLLDYRMLKRTWLGLTLQELTPDLAEQLKLKQQGAIVTEVEANSPAAEASLRRQDLIVAIDDQPVTHPFDFQRMVLRKNAGERISVKYARNGVTKTAVLELRKVVQKSGLELAMDKLGLQLQRITPVMAKELGLDPNIGLVVVGVVEGSPAYKAGMERGDLILRLAGRPVADVDRLGNLLEGLQTGTNVQVLLFRGNAMYRGMLRVK